MPRIGFGIIGSKRSQPPVGQRRISPMPEYKYPDTVRLAINAANARTPRLQPSAVREFGEMISKEVSNGDWSVFDGAPINPAGQNVEESLDFCVSTRPHWEVPATVVDAADDTWTSGNLSKQAK